MLKNKNCSKSLASTSVMEDLNYWNYNVRIWFLPLLANVLAAKSKQMCTVKVTMLA